MTENLTDFITEKEKLTCELIDTVLLFGHVAELLKLTFNTV